MTTRRLLAAAALAAWLGGCAPESGPRGAGGRRGAKSKTLVVYAEAAEDAFFPAGGLGDYDDAVEIQPDCAQKPHGGKVCFRAAYEAAGDAGWAGLYWLYPKGNWGEKPGRSLRGAVRLRFWARGERGGEVVSFKMGGVRGPRPDTAEAAAPKTRLTPDWRPYVIDLRGQDLSNVAGGFAFVVTAADNPKGCVFYLDDVEYVFGP